jgi:preprotein translocase subunit SecE
MVLPKGGMATKMINKSKPIKDLSVINEDPGSFSPAQIKKFINEVKVEASKIVWPDRKVTMGLTVVVIIMSVVMSIYLGSVDLLLGKLVSSFLK